MEETEQSCLMTFKFEILKVDVDVIVKCKTIYVKVILACYTVIFSHPFIHDNTN